MENHLSNTCDELLYRMYLEAVGLLPTSGENFMSIVPLEIYLFNKSVMSSVLILPAGYSVENEADLCD